jgi:hypothetical protein
LLTLPLMGVETPRIVHDVLVSERVIFLLVQEVLKNVLS